MKIELYTRQLCSYCDKAKAALKEHGLSFVEIDCTFSVAKVSEMMERSGRKTFPQIFINGYHVGGCDDLIAKIETGTLVFIPPAHETLQRELPA